MSGRRRKTRFNLKLFGSLLGLNPTGQVGNARCGAAQTVGSIAAPGLAVSCLMAHAVPRSARTSQSRQWVAPTADAAIDWRSARWQRRDRAALQASLPTGPDPTFRSGTQIVSLFATVTDAQNRLVPDLTQDDFEVFDNDKPQPIVLFENENPADHASS